MSRPTIQDTRRRSTDRADHVAAQITCAGASIAYLCLGVTILLRQPLSHTRLTLGLAGVCAVSLLLAIVAYSLAPERHDR